MIRAYRQLIAIIQDGKHSCRYSEQSRFIADAAGSPLFKRDVHKLDRQDDYAAARLFSSATLRFIVERNERDELGLPIFLFVFGELIDAVKSRTLSLCERIKMARQLHHFKVIWKQFLTEAGYAKSKYWISPAADDITDIIVNRLLSLALIYRDHHPDAYPLLLHLHGTQGNEHCFGLLRSFISDFTMTDALSDLREAVPKTEKLLHLRRLTDMHTCPHSYSSASSPAAPYNLLLVRRV